MFLDEILSVLLLQQIHASEKSLESACGLLEAGAEFAAAAKSDYTRLLFLLSKGMVRFTCMIT